MNQQMQNMGIGGLIGAQIGQNVPKVESVSEMLNTIINVAGAVIQSSEAVANAVVGSNPKETSSAAPAPSALIDQLRMIRYMLNEAEGHLSRARQGLGA